MGVKKGKKISTSKLNKTEDKLKRKEKKGKKLSKTQLKLEREVTFAKNARKWAKR